MHRQESDFAACCCRTTAHWAPRYPSLLLFSYHITQPPLLDIPSISPLTRTPHPFPESSLSQQANPTSNPNSKCSKKPALDTRSPSRSPSPPSPSKKNPPSPPLPLTLRPHPASQEARYHSAPPAALLFFSFSIMVYTLPTASTFCLPPPSSSSFKAYCIIPFAQASPRRCRLMTMMSVRPRGRGRSW